MSFLINKVKTKSLSVFIAASLLVTPLTRCESTSWVKKLKNNLPDREVCFSYIGIVCLGALVGAMIAWKKEQERKDKLSEENHARFQEELRQQQPEWDKFRQWAETLGNGQGLNAQAPNQPPPIDQQDTEN